MVGTEWQGKTIKSIATANASGKLHGKFEKVGPNEWSHDFNDWHSMQSMSNSLTQPSILLTKAACVAHRWLQSRKIIYSRQCQQGAHIASTSITSSSIKPM
jgi:hypothetical protein